VFLLKKVIDTLPTLCALCVHREGQQLTTTTMTTITQEQCDTLAKCHQLITTGYDDDWHELYLDPADASITLTLQSIADLKNNDWNEASGFCEEAHEGCAVLYWETVQGSKGDERASLTVVDFGQFRAIYR